MKIIKLQSLCLAAAAAWLAWCPAAKADPADASDPQVDMQIDDQPGYQPSAEEEQLAGPFERQIVFFRTTEAPGTIVVHTADRYLYLVQPNNRDYLVAQGRGSDQPCGRRLSRALQWYEKRQSGVRRGRPVALLRRSVGIQADHQFACRLVGRMHPQDRLWPPGTTRARRQLPPSIEIAI